MGTPITEPLSQVRPEALAWLWDRYLPRGKLVLLDGDPGVGKSLLTLDLAARLSRGDDLPDSPATNRPHTTLLLAAEDDAADTTRPRAEAAGANLERLIVVTGDALRSFRFPHSLPLFTKALEQHEPELVIIDPIVAFLSPKLAVNAEQSIRRVLSKLARLAEAADCTILMIRHLRKAGSANALYRGSGSMAFIALARTALLASRHPTEPDVNVLAVSKTNLADPPPSRGYRLKSDANGRPVVEWLDAVDVDATALGMKPMEAVRPRERAIVWLRDELAKGPRKSFELMNLAIAAGIPERTLLRAKDELGVRSRQVNHPGGGHEWFWYDPSAPWPENAPCRKPCEMMLPPLPDLDEIDSSRPERIRKRMKKRPAPASETTLDPGPKP